ncbi:hypothetical protein [Streptomyces sp. BP-8]|uniref:Uncharacterized protein n=1 Tax=Streptomyces sirii TaxID=3127701 RepID=A0ABZ2QLQ0_9ACTN
MHIIYAPSGAVVAVMEEAEVVVIEAALMRYAAGGVDSGLAVQVLQSVAGASERAERRAEGVAEAVGFTSA